MTRAWSPLRGVRRGVRRSGGISAGALTPAVMRAAEIYLESGTEEQKPPNEKRVTDYKKSETDALFPIFCEICSFTY